MDIVRKYAGSDIGFVDASIFALVVFGSAFLVSIVLQIHDGSHVNFWQAFGFAFGAALFPTIAIYRGAMLRGLAVGLLLNLLLLTQAIAPIICGVLLLAIIAFGLLYAFVFRFRIWVLRIAADLGGVSAK